MRNEDIAEPIAPLGRHIKGPCDSCFQTSMPSPSRERKFKVRLATACDTAFLSCSSYSLFFRHLDIEILQASREQAIN